MALPHFEFIPHSFLHFSPEPFQITHDYDAIFFGSPRAVAFFLTEASIRSEAAIGCVGHKTAKTLKELGYKVDFTLEKSGEIEEAKKEFVQWVGAKKVLFPQSNRSLKSFSNLFDSNQKEEIVVYNTGIKCETIDNCEFYVFSSPSNVEAFLQCNQIAQPSPVIAWGESTKKSLEEHSIYVHHTLSTSNLHELIEVLSNR